MGADGGGFLGDAGNDATTVNTNCSAPTLGTTKLYLKPPINYLAPPTPSSAGCQGANQLISQVGNQSGNQVDFQGAHQGNLQPISLAGNLGLSRDVNKAENKGIQLEFQDATQPFTQSVCQAEHELQAST